MKPTGPTCYRKVVPNRKWVKDLQPEDAPYPARMLYLLLYTRSESPSCPHEEG